MKKLSKEEIIKNSSPLPWKQATWSSDFIVDANGEPVCQFFGLDEFHFKNNKWNLQLILAAINAYEAAQVARTQIN